MQREKVGGVAGGRGVLPKGRVLRPEVGMGMPPGLLGGGVFAPPLQQQMNQLRNQQLRDHRQNIMAGLHGGFARGVRVAPMQNGLPAGMAGVGAGRGVGAGQEALAHQHQQRLQQHFKQQREASERAKR